MIVVNHRIHILAAELIWSFARSSGKGGQNVNKTSTKAVLKFNLLWTQSLPQDVRERALQVYGSRLNSEGELTITSERHRSQDQHAKDCIEKLRFMILRVAEPPKPRIATKPKYSAKIKRVDTKKRHGEKKSSRRKVDWE